jgi:PAS domain S-box-containing protein
MQVERDRILELSQDLISIAGMDGFFKYLNPAWEKTLGYTNEEILGLGCSVSSGGCPEGTV